MKLEPLWKPIEEAPIDDRERFFVKNETDFIYAGCYIDYNGDLQTTIWDVTSRTLHKEDYTWTKDLSQDLVAEFVSETFSATGYVLGVTWEDFEGTLPIGSQFRTNFADLDLDRLMFLIETTLEGSNKSLSGTGDFRRDLGAILCIVTTTIVSIQGHLFTNTSETIEFVGELAEEQKETLRVCYEN